MKNYQFLIEQPGKFGFSFIVTANSPEEAVRMANEATTEPLESDHLSLVAPLHHAYFTLDDDFKVDTSMIVDEAPATHALPTKALEYLESQGYDYTLQDKEDLWHDEEPGFLKYLETMDGDLYAFLKVQAHYEYNIKDWSFRVWAFLYPAAHARMVDGDGGAHYKVNFQDGQLFTTFEELPKVLEVYENKFMELIYALREADPVDGLPL